MDDRNTDDLATLWSSPGGASCIIRARGADWHVRVEQNGVTLREETLPNSRSAMALAGEWEREFKASGAVDVPVSRR